jgi:hypothetical protein
MGNGDTLILASRRFGRRHRAGHIIARWLLMDLFPSSTGLVSRAPAAESIQNQRRHVYAEVTFGSVLALLDPLLGRAILELGVCSS